MSEPENEKVLGLRVKVVHEQCNGPWEASSSQKKRLPCYPSRHYRNALLPIAKIQRSDVHHRTWCVMMTQKFHLQIPEIWNLKP